jgi:hypothetical protein
VTNRKLRATPTQLCDPLGACTTLNAIYRQPLKMTLEELQLLEQQVGRLDTASLFPLLICLAQ